MSIYHLPKTRFTSRIISYFRYDAYKMVKVYALMILFVALLLGVGTYCSTYGPFMAFDEGLVRFIVNSTTSDTVMSFINTTFDVDGAVGSLNMTLKSYACTVCAILWLSSLLTAYINQQAYAEVIVKRILVLGISVFLIYNSDKICQYIADVGTGLANSLSRAVAVEGSSRADAVITAMHEACDKEAEITEEDEMEDIDGIEADKDGAGINVLKGFSKALKGIFSKFLAGFRRKVTVPLTFLVALLIPALATAVGYIMIMIACYSRGVEIAILKVLSPIPMAIIANEPIGSGPAARFLKNLGALSVQGAVLIVISVVCSSLVANSITELASDLTPGGLMQNGIKAGAVAIAEGAMMMKSLTLSQKLFGLQ